MTLLILLSALGACSPAPTWYDNCLDFGCTTGQVCVSGGGEPICRETPEDCGSATDCSTGGLTADACAVALCGESLDGEFDIECFDDGETRLVSFDCDPAVL